MSLVEARELTTAQAVMANARAVAARRQQFFKPIRQEILEEPFVATPQITILDEVAAFFNLTPSVVRTSIGNPIAIQARKIAVILLIHRSGMNKEDAAKEMDLPLDSVEYCLHDARRMFNLAMIPRTAPIKEVIEYLSGQVALEAAKPTLLQIRLAVSEAFSVRASDLKSARRTWDIVRPRQVCFCLMKNLGLQSLPAIGRFMGGKDHTTVMHGVRKYQAVFDRLEKIIPSTTSPLDWAVAFHKEPTPPPVYRRYRCG